MNAKDKKEKITTMDSVLPTTAIGSLPHHNVDSALEYSFRYSIPYLPQIPIRKPAEYMIPQALDGLPGLEVSLEGGADLNLDVWATRAREIDEALLESFSRSTDEDAFSRFEPKPHSYSCFQPFLWELQERQLKFCKMQLAGPLTTQWSVRVKGSSRGKDWTDVASQAYRLVLARSIAMVRAAKRRGMNSLFFFDEPGLYGLNPGHLRHALGLSELGVCVKTLRKEGAEVGIHCCSDTAWGALMLTEVDVLSVDVNLSLESILSTPELGAFIDRGGRLSFGMIPSIKGKELTAEVIAKNFLEKLYGSGLSLEQRTQVLTNSLLTPACGLALHTPDEVEHTLEMLGEVRSRLVDAVK